MSLTRRYAALDWVVAVTVVLNLVFGIVSVVTGTNMFFVALSLLCLGGLCLGFLHGVPTVGAKCVLIMMGIGAVVSLVFESLGINFGWFFSQYVYTDFIPGPKLFGFNLYSVLGYGLGVYLLWAVAQAAVGRFDNRLRRSELVLIPAVAALLLVSVDLATDPLLATINGAYQWQQPGVYYGIPFQNYLGWYLMAYVLYQLVALVVYWLQGRGDLPETPPIARTARFWVYPVLLFAALLIQLPFYLFIPDATVTVSSGQVFSTSEIYRGVLVVYIGAILTPSLIIIARLFRTSELQSAATSQPTEDGTATRETERKHHNAAE